MARQELPKEDLIAQATALVHRVEFLIPEIYDPIVIGFRRDGSASLFLGDDPVYQFNAGSELRRAHLGGFLIKAEQGELVRLRRHRADGEVQLLRRHLTDQETTEIFTELTQLLNRIQRSLEDQSHEVLRQVPEDVDVMSMVRQWLATISRPAEVAESAGLAS